MLPDPGPSTAAVVHRPAHREMQVSGRGRPSTVPGVEQTDELTRQKVLRAFLDDEGRLRSIPARRGKRLVVLQHVLAAFEPAVRYPEREVNERLRAFHPDVAALRRYLVDERLLDRTPGVYWRPDGDPTAPA